MEHRYNTFVSYVPQSVIAWHALMINRSNFPFPDSLINPSSDIYMHANKNYDLSDSSVDKMHGLRPSQARVNCASI